MRVLFITGEFPPMQGGVGDCTREIARGLAALGVEAGVLTSQAASSKQQAAGSKQQAAGSRQQVAGSRSFGSAQEAAGSERLSVLPAIRCWNWFSLRVITNAIRELAPDIVHIQYQTGAYGMHPAINFLPRWLRLVPPVPVLSKRSDRAVKSVVTFHDLRFPYLFPKAGPLREWVTRELAHASDAVIATNNEDYLQLATWNLKLLSLTPIGSNILITESPNYQRSAWRAQLGVGENEILLCYFGFLNESKGGETLIRALALVPNAKLLMIGGQVGASDPTNIAYLSKIKSLISNLQLTGRVLWTDYTPPEIVTANFRASDICVLPYRDGASYRRGTLMAALAHGMAIVTTAGSSKQQTAGSSKQQAAGSSKQQAAGSSKQQAAGSSKQQAAGSILPALRDGENCLLVPPDDPRALAAAIQRAAASPELRAKIRAGARQLAQHFTWDKIAQQHLQLYTQLHSAL